MPVHFAPARTRDELTRIEEFLNKQTLAYGAPDRILERIQSGSTRCDVMRIQDQFLGFLIYDRAPNSIDVRRIVLFDPAPEFMDAAITHLVAQKPASIRITLHKTERFALDFFKPLFITESDSRRFVFLKTPYGK